MVGIAMAGPSQVRCNALFVGPGGQHPGKVLFDGFPHPGMGMAKNVTYKVNTPGFYRKYLPVGFYIQFKVLLQVGGNLALQIM